MVSAGPEAPHPREATLAHGPRDQRGKWEGAQEATRLAEGASDPVQGAEGKARAVLPLSSQDREAEAPAPGGGGASSSMLSFEEGGGLREERGARAQ